MKKIAKIAEIIVCNQIKTPYVPRNIEIPFKTFLYAYNYYTYTTYNPESIVSYKKKKKKKIVDFFGSDGIRTHDLCDLLITSPMR